MKRKIGKKVAECILAVAMTVSSMPVGMILEFGENVYAQEVDAGVESSFQYEILETGTASITGYTGIETKVVVPDTIDGKSVTRIGGYAFKDCSSLEEISLPEGLTSIEYSAFKGCSSLKEINLPEGLTSIGWNAFGDCSSLKEISLPESLTSTGNYVFESCSSLEKINLPEGLTSIGSGAFDACSSLEEINLPEGLTSIGEYAFRDCSSLKEINLPEGLTSIGEHVFRDCSSLKEVNLPEGLTSIGSGAFESCTSLKEINLPEGLTSIGPFTFSCCSSLKEINLPEGMTSIGWGAFDACSSLEEINLPKGLTNIGGEAFSGCSSLKEINLPESMTSIGVAAFYNCINLKKIEMNSNNNANYQTIDGVLYNREGTELIVYPNMKGSSYTVPEGVTSIGRYAFSGCSSLEEIILPEGMTSIGNLAFSGCSSLKEINLPESVTSIGNNVFSNCTNLKKIEMNSDNNANYQTIDGVLYNREGTELIAYPNMKGSFYTVPEGVTSIGDYAFRGCSSLEEIHLPEGMTSIGRQAFGDCSSLKEISLPEGMTSIRNYAFESCSSLEEIHLPEGMTSIGSFAFIGCSSLEEIILPESVTSIGEAVFSNCIDLKKIEMNSDNNANYQTIDGILYNREGTKLIAYPNMKGSSYTVPEGVTSIGNYAFSGCSSLKEINLPEGLTDIGYSAFSNCSNLNKVEMPKSMSSIGQVPFENSPNVVIYGFSNSYAETYAKSSDIPFVAKIELTSDTGVNVVYTEDAFSGAVTLQATLLTADDANYNKINIANLLADKTVEASTVKYQPYEITLSDETGQPVQPSSAVTVKLPCPEGYDGSKCKVYYVADDGTLTDMQAVYTNGYLSFETTHFSTYMVTDTELSATVEVKVLYGDVNGDGEISLMDSALIRRYLAGWSVTIDEKAADVNGDGEISLMDSALIRRYLAGWNVTLGEK